MRPTAGAGDNDRVEAEIRSLARPLGGTASLDALVDRVRAARFLCIGEASQGTSDFYRWRAQLSRRLVEQHGFTWIGVEGDWPDREAGTYVPTRIGGRYDALIWLDGTDALRALHHEARPTEPELETEPTGLTTGS